MDDFHNMQEYPKRATTLNGDDENFSLPVLVFDEDNPSFCEIGHYNFNCEMWSHFGDDSMKLICWCYPPNPTTFLKGKNFESVLHIGYRS